MLLTIVTLHHYWLAGISDVLFKSLGTPIIVVCLEEFQVISNGLEDYRAQYKADDVYHLEDNEMCRVSLTAARAIL